MNGRRNRNDNPMDRVRRVFDAAAPWYRLFDRFFRTLNRELIEEIRRHMPLTEETRILEVCCGTGLFARMLSELGGRVIAVDISPRMIEIAKRYDTTGAVDFRVADARDPSLADDGPFDLVIESLGLHALDPDIRAGIVDGMRRHTKHRALFIEPTGRGGGPLVRAINDILERLEGGYEDYRSFISMDFSEYLKGHGFIPHRLQSRRDERTAVFLCEVRRGGDDTD